MERIRCKFIVGSVEHDACDGTPARISVKARAVWDNSPENREFSTMTPWGDLSFGVDNPAVIPSFLSGGALAPGREFYLDLVVK